MVTDPAQSRPQPGHLAGVPRVEDGLVDGDDLAGDDVPVEGPRALPPQSREGRASLWVAEQLGVHREALRTWVRKAQAEGQDASSVSADRDARLAQLEKENRELRRANTILKQASAFFAAELDRPQR